MNKTGQTYKKIKSGLSTASKYPDRPMKEIFTAREECFRPVISSIKQAMRECFSSKFAYLNKSKRAKQTSLELTHDIRASKIKEILCS